ncbi:MAG TPA: histidine kinase dimerization/phospho-acceptor domain-containing protein [Nocardioidaceae bacterium]|nr:histidine kinase dimerization/phospho-acceptor domain-containing protein [Nocardioidaceae bacterium]
MRERLIAAFVGLTVLVLGVFAVWNAYALADLVRHQEQRKIERSAVLLAAVLGDRAEAGTPVTPAFLTGLLNEGEHVEYVDADGSLVEATAPGGDRAGQAPGDLMESLPVAGGGEVRLSRSGEIVSQRIEDQLLPNVLLGVGLVLAAVLLGWWAARGLSRPFRDLASSAAEIGRGRFDIDIPHHAIPEAEAIGSAMRESATRLDGLVRRERAFAANASHELRTPITALRLELEDLLLARDTSPEQAAAMRRALGQVDRLSETVDGMLDGARAGREAESSDIDVSALARDTVRRWRSRAPGRAVTDRVAGVVPVRLPHRAVAEILDVLLDNAVRHGAGAITVQVDDVGTHVEVRVSDQGEAAPGPGLLTRRPGGGLTHAVETADSLGARIRFEDGRQTCVVVLLPKPSRDRVGV